MPSPSESITGVSTSTEARQLDIFADSRDVMLRNDLVDALLRRDAAASQKAWDRLAAEHPGDAVLAPARLLLAALDRAAEPGAPTAAAHPAAAQLVNARSHLREHLAPAAAAVLGREPGGDWVLPLWRNLAAQHAQRSWNPAQPDDHAAPLWLTARAWPEAAASAGSIASWRRIPLPLAWMVEARCQQAGIDENWPLLAELAWLAPRRFSQLLQALDDPLLNRLKGRFEDLFDIDGTLPGDKHDALAWFPAWVLTDSPALAPRLAQAEPGQDSAAERGLRLMVQLLGLERQGRHHDLVARRKALRDLCAPLYAAYMATR